MATSTWSLQRAYGSLIFPQKGGENPAVPTTYTLRLDAEFRGALIGATTGAARMPLSGIVLKMNEDREHPIRDLVMKVAFGQTRTPQPAVSDLAGRLSTNTDGRTGSSLLVTTVEDADDKRRVSLYVFPEEDTFALRSNTQEPAEAALERLKSFVLQSRLRKVARFEGKEIKTHFLRGEVADLQIGSSPRTAADYWVSAFLDAEFAITEEKGTRYVADGLRKAFENAGPDGKQSIMEAATGLVASSRQVWTLDRIASDFLPGELHATFFSVAQNAEARTEKFKLSKALLKDRINYRVFRLETGVWVSSPFGEVGKSVKLERSGGKRILTARGAVESEKVQRDAKRPTRDPR